MKYDVKLIRNDEGKLRANIWRVEWFGLLKTLIGHRVSSSRVDYEPIIRHDFLRLHKLEYDFESETKIDKGKRING